MRNWRRIVLATALPVALVIAFPIGRASADGTAPAAATGAPPTAPVSANAATSSVAARRAGLGPRSVQAATAEQAAHPGVPLTRCLPLTTRCSPGPPLSPSTAETGVAFVGVLGAAVGALGLLLVARGRRMWRAALAAGAFDRLLRPPRALVLAA